MDVLGCPMQLGIKVDYQLQGTWHRTKSRVGLAARGGAKLQGQQELRELASLRCRPTVYCGEGCEDLRPYSGAGTGSSCLEKRWSAGLE